MVRERLARDGGQAGERLLPRFLDGSEFLLVNGRPLGGRFHEGRLPENTFAGEGIDLLTIVSVCSKLISSIFIPVKMTKSIKL